MSSTITYCKWLRLGIFLLNRCWVSQWFSSILHGFSPFILLLKYPWFHSTLQEGARLSPSPTSVELECYGITSTLQKWLVDFFIGQRQRVVIVGEASKWKTVKNGIPRQCHRTCTVWHIHKWHPRRLKLHSQDKKNLPTTHQSQPYHQRTSVPQTNGPGTDNFISIPAKYTPSNLAGKWETPIPHRGRFAGADQWSRCHRIPKTEIPQTHGISHQASKWSPQPNLMDHQVQRKENHHPLNTALVWPLHGYENVRWSPRYKKKSK